MKKLFAVLVVAVVAFFCAEARAQQSVRVKDMAVIKGADDNYLKGIGLVVGLNGTGDSDKNVQTSYEVANMLAKWENISIHPSMIKNKNIAVVTVSAKIAAFQNEGTKIDIEVASTGDAKSLRGGTLLITPLRGPRAMDDNDKETEVVYAIAQGNLYIGAGRDTPQTKGAITSGATVVKSIDHTTFMANLNSDIVVLHINRPDFNVANAIAEKINLSPNIEREVGEMEIAIPISSGEVRVAIPKAYSESNQRIKFVSELLEINVDILGGSETVAKVIIDDKTKSWFIGGTVKVSKCTVLAGDTKVVITDEDIAKGVTLSDVINALTMTKTSSIDIIEILRKMNDAKVIQAEVIIN